MCRRHLSNNTNFRTGIVKRINIPLDGVEIGIRMVENVIQYSILNERQRVQKKAGRSVVYWKIWISVN